jgi:hypothetical protein
MIYCRGMQRLVVIAALAACGSSKDEPPRTDKVEPPKTPEQPVAPAKQPDTVNVNGPARMVRPPPGDPQRGKCTFTLSGGMTGEFSAPASSSSVLASYWLVDPTARKMMFKNDEEGLIINCGSGNDTLSFTARAKTKDEVPYGPKKYELGPKKGPIHIIGSIQKAGVMGGTGTFEITAYDAEHIAGTFDFTAEILGNKVDGPVTIKGNFDFKCPTKCK